jgi:phytanoyl-CoA hydroxylase
MTTQQNALLSERRRDFDRDGFIVVRHFLPADELSELNHELHRYIQTVVPTLPSTHAFFDAVGRPETLKQLQHMSGDPFFAAYRSNPRWLQLATELLGEDCAAQEPEWFNKPPNTEHVTPPHQDNYYFCLRPPSVVTMWLALDPIDTENGCLRYVAGSHKNGIRPHNATKILGFSQGITDYCDADCQKEVGIHLAPGDLLVHHGKTIHRADANRSVTRHRRAFAMVFRGVSCQRDEDAFARYQAGVKSQHEQVAQQQQQ